MVKYFSRWPIFWGYMALVSCLLGANFYSLQNRIKAQKADRHVSIAIDWEDLRIFSLKEKVAVNDLLESIKEIPIQFIVAPPSLNSPIETWIRNHKQAIIWKGADNEEEALASVLSRFKQGDGFINSGDKVLGYPRGMDYLIQEVKRKEGFFPLVEFAPQTGKSHVAKALFPSIIKTHCLQAKERLSQQTQLHINRLIRAVAMRWNRLLYIQFSPTISFSANLKFIADLALNLEKRGYVLAENKSFPYWNSIRVAGGKILMLGTLLFFPILIAWVLNREMTTSPIIIFLLMSFAATLSGVVVYSLGAAPAFSIGLDQVRGVKIHLLFPMVGSFILLYGAGRIKENLNVPMTLKSLIIPGLVLVVFLGGTMMRSGNFPALPVLDSERYFRDFLENFFTVRPRFKEFLIGHPLLIAGLFMKFKSSQNDSFFRSGHFFIWLGLIGQISILNTFVHFHTSLEASLLRTGHGLWLGLLAGILFCYLLQLKKISVSHD